MQSGSSLVKNTVNNNKTTFSEVRHLIKGAGEGATKQKGSVCFQAKVYTVNAAEIARPGD